MLLWVIVAAVVAMMVFWAIRQFGTRSSAEPQSFNSIPRAWVADRVSGGA